MIKIYLTLLALLVLRGLTFNLGTATTSSIRGRIEQEPIVYKGHYELKVNGARVYVPINSVYHYGDYVVIENGQVQKFKPGRGEGQQVFARVRAKIERVYKRTLLPRQAEILAGMVLGAEGMDGKLKSELANAGLIHLVVASGMNLTLVGGFCFALFTGLHLHKRWIALLSSLAVILYAAMTGFNPPIVRALIMFEAVMVGGLVGRKSGGFFALMTAGYVMLWVNPALITSYSFLLSFASMMGQLFVSTINVKLPAVLSAIVLVVLQNLLALVFTAPIILIGFSRFSLISIISNLLVVWMVEPLMIGGSLAGIVGFLGLTTLAQFLLIPLAFLLDFFLQVVRLFGESEKFVWRIEWFNVFMAIGYYLVLGASIHYFFRRTK